LAFIEGVIDNTLSVSTNRSKHVKIPSMERNTQQRQAILSALRKAKRPLSVQELLESAQKRCPGLGVATVYRNVKALLAEEELVSVDMPGGVVLYEIPDAEHHHHFSCLKCSKVFDIEACRFNFQKLIPDGFQLSRHEILLSGLCRACSN
jgi:Fur family ferric uptake transcriptional regulator